MAFEAEYQSFRVGFHLKHRLHLWSRAVYVCENQIPGGYENQIKLKNFGGLVLFCINADFCVQILIFQHF